MVGARDEHVARRRLDRDIVRAPVAFDIEFFNLERLRTPDAGRARLAAAIIATTVRKRLVIRNLRQGWELYILHVAWVKRKLEIMSDTVGSILKSKGHESGRSAPTIRCSRP